MSGRSLVLIKDVDNQLYNFPITANLYQRSQHETL